MPENATETFLTVRQLAERYGVARRTVYWWNEQGSGPRWLKIGGELRYRLSDVLAYEEARLSNGGDVA